VNTAGNSAAEAARAQLRALAESLIGRQA